MKFTILFFLIAGSSFSLAAERAVIQQMKGKRAVVQFEKDIPFSVGQKVYLVSEDGTELGVRKELRNFMERKNSVNVAFDLYSLETKNTSGTLTSNTSTTFFSIVGSYGWNMEQYEFGPLFEYSYRKPKSSSENTSYLFGGFFDYNLIPNKPGEDFIFGAYGQAALGNSKESSASFSVTQLTAGGFAKWFFLSPILALRGNLYYLYQKQGEKIQNTATGVEIVLSHYF